MQNLLPLLCDSREGGRGDEYMQPQAGPWGEEYMQPAGPGE